MTSFRIRPRFRFTTASSGYQIKKEMRQKIGTAHPTFESTIVHGHLVVKVKGSEQQYWSPQLDMAFEELSDGKTLIRGLYGPNPNIWTLFMFLYGSVILLILFFFIYEGVQYSLGIMDSFSWAIPILIIIGIVLYIISQLGQKLAAEQTFALHHVLEEALHHHIEID